MVAFEWIWKFPSGDQAGRSNQELLQRDAGEGTGVLAEGQLHLLGLKQYVGLTSEAI